MLDPRAERVEGRVEGGAPPSLQYAGSGEPQRDEGEERVGDGEGEGAG